MNKESVLQKLSVFVNETGDRLEIPYPGNQYVTISINIDDFVTMINSPGFDIVSSGWKPYFDRWLNDGYITLDDYGISND